MQSKIKTEHLLRDAYIYIRQSSMAQVKEHEESRRVQYRLAERAVAFGWPEPVILDDDLGRRIGYEIGILDRRRHDRNLVRPGVQKVSNVLKRANAAADSQRHEAAFRRALNHVENHIAVLV